MTRTDRILAAIATAIEKRRPSIDADDGLDELVAVVRLSPTGVPRAVKIERQTFDDLTASRPTT
jgi:hypothetical protein